MVLLNIHLREVKDRNKGFIYAKMFITSVIVDTQKIGNQAGAF